MGLTTKNIHPVDQHPHAFNICLSSAIQAKSGFGAVEAGGCHSAEDISPKPFLTIPIRTKRTRIGPVYLDIVQRTNMRSNPALLFLGIIPVFLSALMIVL